MDLRDRFLATMAFEPVERPPLWEFGYWPETIRRWYREGLPRQVGFADRPDLESVYGEALMWDSSFPPRDQDVHVHLGFDEGIRRVPLNSLVYPPFERHILEENGDIFIFQDERGQIRREKKDRSSVPQIIKPPVRNREDWEVFKTERLQATLKERLPSDWITQRPELKEGDFPLAIGGT